MKKHDDDKPVHAEEPKHEDAKDKRIAALKAALEYLKENAVQGNYQHVARIEAALRD